MAPNLNARRYKIEIIGQYTLKIKNEEFKQV